MVIQYLRRLPLTLKVILVALGVGLAVWGATGEVLTRAVVGLFRSSMEMQLANQDQDYRLRFERYVLSYRQAVKLYAGNTECVRYAEAAASSGWAGDKSEIQRRSPKWLPTNSVQRSFVIPDFALLLDASGTVRETYAIRDIPLPPELAHPGLELIQRSDNASYVSTMAGHSYLTSSAKVVSQDGATLAILVIASPIDEHFLQVSQGFFTKGILVALVRGNPPSVMVSSDESALPQGAPLEPALIGRMERKQQFFMFGAGDVDFKFVSLAATDDLNAMTAEFLRQERFVQVVAATCYVLAFALVMFAASRRINTLTARVRHYETEHGLSVCKAPGTGDELDILDVCFGNLMSEIRKREEYLDAANEELSAQAEELTNANQSLIELDELKSEWLSEANMRLRLVSRAVEQSPVSVVITGPDAVIEYVNPSYLATTGYSWDEVIGTLSPILARDGALPVGRFLVRQALDAGLDWRGEHVSHAKNGREYWEMSVISPVRGEDGSIGRYLIVSEDITDRKHAELALIQAKDAAMAANKAKSEFLANMSHEIRTPLNGVMGMLQVLGGTELSADQRGCLDAAMISSMRLTRLLADILDLSRIEAGKLVFRNSEIPVQGIRDALLDAHALAARDKGLEFSCTVDPSMPQTVVGDELRVRQILFNLVGNAVKFTEHGGVNVDISALAQDGRGGLRVLFVVCDTGIGLSDEQIREVFEPFAQVETSYTRHFQGAGLGLTIVRRLVTLMGGSLSIDNGGPGICLYLSLPFSLPDVPERLSVPALPRQAAPATEAKPAEGLRVLMVEDDAVNRLAGKHLLKQCGFESALAGNGRQALEMLAAEAFDLVLMDVQMPVMDGLTATRRIRAGEAGEANRDIPIIALTAYAMSGDREKFLEAGMNDYLSKPVEVETIKDAVARLPLRRG